MPRIDELPSDNEKSVSPRPPGFLLTPFGWAAEPLAAMVHSEPSLLAYLFAISRPQMLPRRDRGRPAQHAFTNSQIK
jgi:hypothetical protein